MSIFPGLKYAGTGMHNNVRIECFLKCVCVCVHMYVILCVYVHACERRLALTFYNSRTC